MSAAMSIIMPVHNDADFLPQAIKSALGQTIEDLELLCIDDGSTDDSPQILAQYAAADARMRVIRQDNAGAGKARNNGLRQASGEFIAFLDADDYYPNAEGLQKLYELAKSRGVHIAGGSLLFLKHNVEEPARMGSTNFTFSTEEVLRYADLQQAYYYQRFIYSNALITEAQLQFPDYRRFQDVVFFVKAMVAADEFATTPLPVYAYRKNVNYLALSDKQINGMLLGYIDVLTIARDNDLKELAKFLGRRIHPASKVQKMVLESIRADNDIAKIRYATIRTLLDEILGKGWDKRTPLPRRLLMKTKAALLRPLQR